VSFSQQSMETQDWQLRIDPDGLLEAHQPTAGGHQFRLFACACVRQVWDCVDDESCRAAVEWAERYSRGDASRRELVEAFGPAQSAAHVTDNAPVRAVIHYARYAAAFCARGVSYTLADALTVAWFAACASGYARLDTGADAARFEREGRREKAWTRGVARAAAAQRRLVRELFGGRREP
jgi:hypothetical protein